MFKDKLKKLRQKNKLTQDGLAERLFVSRTLVAKWEAGSRYPGRQTLKEIAELFGLTYEELVSEDTEALASGDELESCLPKAENENGETGAPEDSAEEDGNEVLIGLLAKKLSGFLRSLPPEERKMFMRRYYYYDAPEKIAADFGKSTDEVRSLLAEIRAKISCYFEKEGF